MLSICMFALCGTAKADPQITECLNAGGNWIGGGNGCAWPPGSGTCGNQRFYRGQTCSCGGGGCTVTGPRTGDRAISDPQLLNLAKRSVLPSTGNKGALDNHGEIDGVYSCNASIADSGTAGAPFHATVSINGHADGSSVILVAAESKAQPLYGYGNGKIGDIDGHSFHGTTSFNQPFAMKASYLSSTGGKALDEIALSGTFGLSATRMANLTCIAK